jgi:hypothetical protein
MPTPSTPSPEAASERSFIPEPDAEVGSCDICGVIEIEGTRCGFCTRNPLPDSHVCADAHLPTFDCGRGCPDPEHNGTCDLHNVPGCSSCHHCSGECEYGSCHDRAEWRMHYPQEVRRMCSRHMWFTGLAYPPEQAVSLAGAR